MQYRAVIPISEALIHLGNQISNGVESLSTEDLWNRLCRRCNGRNSESFRSPRLGSDSLLIHSSESPTYCVPYLVQSSVVSIIFHPDLLQYSPFLVDVEGKDLVWRKLSLMRRLHIS